MSISPKIEEDWGKVLAPEFQKDYFSKLKETLVLEKKTYPIYPPGKSIFSAFNTTPFSKVKIVILGQDPYHGPGQAHGLSFSVPMGIKPPPSLVNIFKELHADLGIEAPKCGDLSAWASQGVFLLNAFLTVRAHEPASHQKIGWHFFTDAVIQSLSSQKEHLVFMLWGSFAQSKADLIDKQRHLILQAAHPSPFSVHRGFLGCKHFSKANEYLRTHGLSEINWALDS